MKVFVTALIGLSLILIPVCGVFSDTPASGTAVMQTAAAEHDFGLATETRPAATPAPVVEPAMPKVSKPAPKPVSRAKTANAKRALAAKQAKALKAERSAHKAAATVAVMKPVNASPAQNKVVASTPSAVAPAPTRVKAVIPVAASNTGMAAHDGKALQTPKTTKPQHTDKIALLLQEKAEEKPAPRSSSDWAKTGLATIVKLAFVLGLAYVTILGLKWLSNKRESTPHSSKDMRMLDTLKLNTNNSVHLISVHGKTLLIGSTAGQLNLLTEVEPAEPSAVEPETDKKFSEYLDKYYGGSKYAGPASRVAGMLRDATAHMKGKQSRVMSTANARAGGGDES